MGNEMGNQNATALKLKEEESTVVEAPEKALHEDVLADEVKGENQLVTAAENREQSDTELKPPLNPHDPMESNDEVIGIQTPSSKDEENDEKPIESSLDENLLEDLEPSDQPKQKQPSIRTEAEEGERTDSTIDLSMDQKPDQTELAKVHDEPQEEESSCWPQDKKEVIGTSMSHDDEEKGHLLETETAISLANIVASQTDLDIEKINGDRVVKEMNFEEEKSEKCEIISEDEVGNGLSNKATEASVSKHGDFRNNYEGELPSEMSLSRNDSSEAISQSDSLDCFREVAPELHDKRIVLAEEAKVLEAENEYDPNLVQFNELVKEDLKIERLEAVESNIDSGRENEDKYELPMNDLEAENMSYSQSSSSLVGPNSDNGSENEDKYEHALNDLEAEKMSASQSSSLLVGTNSDNGSENEDKFDPKPIHYNQKALSHLEEEKMDASQSDLLLVVSNSDNVEEDEEKYDPKPIKFSEQAMNELETQKMEASRCGSTLVCSDQNGMEILADSSSQPRIGNSRINKEEVIENGYKPNSASDQQHFNDSEAEVGTFPTELTVTNYKQGEEQTSEDKTINENEEKAENSRRIGCDSKEREAIEQHVGTASLLSQCPMSPLQHQDHKDILNESTTSETMTLAIGDSKEESCSELFVTKASILDCTNSTNAAETETLLNQSTKPFGNVGFGARERKGRLSIESNPENSTTPIELRKSPSFDFDFSVGARSEESDQTPLLHHDKMAMRRFLSHDSVDFGNSMQYQAMQVEEKTITMETSNSEKSRAPFLSLLEGNKQANVVVSPKKQESLGSDKLKEVAITSSKGNAKRKPKSSIFTTCLCCAASIH